MTLAHRYDEFREDFETGELEHHGSTISAEENLQAFENGYQAGWQDATTAHEAEKGKLLSELAQNFQNMQFSTQEARSKILKNFRPIATAMLEKLLPGLLRETLRANLTEQLNEALAQATKEPIEINVSAEYLSTVQEIMDTQKGAPISIKENAELSGAQVMLSSTEWERHIDIDVVCDRISQALLGFVEQANPEISYG